MKAIFAPFGWTASVLVFLLVGFFVIQIASRMPESNSRMYQSRVKADMRSLNSEFAVHFEKSNTLPVPQPLINAAGDDFSLIKAIKSARGENLQTYPADLTPDLTDPFSPDRSLPYAYHAQSDRWMVSSAGPDADYDLNPKVAIESNWTTESAELILLTYDPTNGSFSDGDVYRTGSLTHNFPK